MDVNLLSDPIVTTQQDTKVEDNVSINNMYATQPMLVSATQSKYQMYVDEVQLGLDKKAEYKRQEEANTPKKSILGKLFGSNTGAKKKVKTKRTDVYKGERDKVHAQLNTFAMSSTNLCDAVLVDCDSLMAANAPDRILLLMNTILRQIDLKLDNFDKITEEIEACKQELKSREETESNETCHAILDKWKAYYAELAQGGLALGAEKKELSLGGYKYKPQVIIADKDEAFTMNNVHDRYAKAKAKALTAKKTYNKEYTVFWEEKNRSQDGTSTAPNKVAPLFTHKPDVNDIKQGKVGDCYFVAMLASKAKTDPASITDMIRDNYPENTVTVRFYRKVNAKAKLEELQKKSKSAPSNVEPVTSEFIFEPVYVTVKKSTCMEIETEKDKKGRVTSETKRDLFAKNTLWVQLIEKAYAASGLRAEAWGEEFTAPGYDSITGGTANVALEHLSGKSPVEVTKAITNIRGRLNPKSLLGNIGNSVLTEEQKKETNKVMSAITPQLATAIKDKLGKSKEAAKAMVASLITSALEVDVDRNKTAKVVNHETGRLEDKDYYKAIPTMETMVQMVLTSNIAETVGERKEIAALLVEMAEKSSDSQMQYGSFSGFYKKDTLELYEKIKQGLANNMIINTGSVAFAPEEASKVAENGERIAKGIFERHMYSVLGVHEVKETTGADKKEKTVKFVTLRNPWGEGIGIYNEREDGSIHHNSIERKGKLSQESDGVMIIELNEFASKFQNITIG